MRSTLSVIPLVDRVRVEVRIKGVAQMGLRNRVVGVWVSGAPSATEFKVLTRFTLVLGLPVHWVGVLDETTPGSWLATFVMEAFTTCLITVGLIVLIIGSLVVVIEMPVCVVTIVTIVVVVGTVLRVIGFD